LSLRWLLSLARQRPPSPAIVVATAATDGGGCTRQIIAVPPPRELSLFCLRCHLS
jgi:cytochrome c553